jgi:hypothetical protein
MPRPRKKDLSGTLLGALVGAALAGPAGALFGGVAGSAVNNEDQAVPLEQAVAAAVQQMGLVFVSLRRASRYAAAVTFRLPDGTSYFVVKGFVRPRAGGRPQVEIDDELYDQLVEKLERWPGGRTGGA